MSSQSKTVSPLRQRMIEDMRMRKLAPQTQVAYIRAVRKFARCLNRAPDTATAEDLRNFQLHLVDHGAPPITLNATIRPTYRAAPGSESAGNCALRLACSLHSRWRQSDPSRRSRRLVSE